MADRAVSPVVGKVLEIGLVLLFATAVTAAVSGSVVPHARTAAGDELADRTLATAATGVEDAVPEAGRNVSATAHLDLPDRIRGESYTLRTEGRTLVLDHPHAGVGATHRLALPTRVAAVRGTVESDESVVVRVTSTPAGLVVEVTAA
ncbi:MAG: hypothetical protein ABEJ68_06630 [Halobacteriaceae archaeon]